MQTSAADHPIERRGRAALNNDSGRFEAQTRVPFDDDWGTRAGDATSIETTLHTETPRAIITRNTSPDIPFEQSINAYRGCEHGCVYCFARPSHAYMGLSAGLDFETEIFTKPNAAALLEKEITRPGYVQKTIALGTNTDPYQPAERRLRLTQQILEVLDRHDHPVSITTKSDRILDDLEVLRSLSDKGLVRIALSVTTLDHRLARTLEPRAATPARRLDALAKLSEAGIPTCVMVAPVIPGLTDHEIERILAASANAGVTDAAWVLLRLPGEVSALFEQWLSRHAPDRKNRVLSALRALRGGKLNDPRFGERLRGNGPVADLLSQRFKAAARRHGLQAMSSRWEGANAQRQGVWRGPQNPKQRRPATKAHTRDAPKQLSLF
ncbi:MAG: PA0069 family radical SAM protein [Pseudomonadota bacterium]